MYTVRGVVVLNLSVRNDSSSALNWAEIELSWHEKGSKYLRSQVLQPERERQDDALPINGVDIARPFRSGSIIGLRQVSIVSYPIRIRVRVRVRRAH